MSSRVQCRAHPNSQLIEDYRAGDMICSECGLVVGDRVIDVGSEWRTFSNDKGGEDRSRVGDAENPLFGSSDLSTMIAPAIGSGVNADYQNRRTLSSSEKTMMNAFRTIASMSDRHNLPRTISERAKALFKVVHEGRSLRGRSTEAISAACLYISCRQEGVPRTFKEIVAVSTVSKKEIGRCFKLILKAHNTNVDVITTSDFMTRFCATLELPRTVQQCATSVAQAAMELDVITGRSPISVAAAAIYMASQASSTPKSTKEISEIAGVAEVTIKQSYKLMLPKAASLFPTDFKLHIPLARLPNA